MSLLAPLYALGLMAISLPLIFHLIRRTPRGEMMFSSLMFLKPSPPRITKRSRLDNLLLLLLRALAIACLAVAFARPFFRQAGGLEESAGVSQRVAVLIDTSASMRRGALWSQAVQKLDETIAEYRPQDHYAVFAYDETLRPIASFEDLSSIDPSRRRQTVDTLIKESEPTWAGTRLGLALAEAVAALQGASEDADAVASKRIVLIGDLQSGAHLDELAGYEWPNNIALELVPLEAADPTNAGLEMLGNKAKAQTVEDARDERLRVRVTNSEGSTKDNFTLQWTGPDNKPIGDPVEIYAPAGESRVARLEAPTSQASPLTLTLAGDAHDYDNAAAYLPAQTETARVTYLGKDDDADPKGLAYYLRRALESQNSLTTEMTAIAVGDQAVAPEGEPQMVVVGAPPSDTQQAELRDYVQSGGLVLYVVSGGDDGGPLGELLGLDDLEISEAKPSDYAMLTQIDFDHPLFSSMAGPQFNNFTQILFTNYRRVDDGELDDAVMLARFDTGDPAIWQSTIGEGRVIVMTGGWSPGDSQLARSWKFPLMLASLMESRRDPAFAAAYLVNQEISLPEGVELTADPMLTKPDGQQVLLAADANRITDTDMPGVYSVSTAGGPAEFVVHLDPLESNTLPLPKEAFEQAGAKLSGSFDAEAEEATFQRLRDAELESRQHIWKWLVVVALVLLIAETLLSGWTSRRSERSSSSELSPAAA